MYRDLLVYISASEEMDAECELVGQFLADITKGKRWTIKRTPSVHQAENPDIEALTHSQFYIAILGTDLVAPIGVEWQAAKRAGVCTFAYRNAQIHPSPSMTHFLREVDSEIEDYNTPSEFIRELEKALLSAMIEATPGLGLDLADIEELSARLKALEEEEQERAPDERRGAAGGGIILPSP